ncbi:response regulator [Flammeovirgaceae bacterium SG7u.111]|nr:response regulator [Flammeovirgaceae bacterium SG7u.132]WPO34551.1 response regulator [Flammeovirgaceae bacterium SG7u.111]
MSKKNILLIEDDRALRTLLEFVLSEDFNVISQENAISALAWLEKNTCPDLILTDLMMPEISGMEFTKTIRSSSLYRNIPIIILSGKENSDSRIRLLAIGADDFITKPFNPVEVVLRIKNIFKRTVA